MPEPTLAVAITLMSVTAICFVGSMVRFFRANRGHWALRIVLFASLAGGLLALFLAMARGEAIAMLPFAIGCALVVSAQALFWSAVTAHGRNRPSGAFAVDPPATLIERGPYRMIRHPFYVAYVLAFAGGATFTEASWAWVVPAWFAVIYALAAAQEERLILASFLGEAYGDYMNRTGAFVPRFRAIQPEHTP